MGEAMSKNRNEVSVRGDTHAKLKAEAKRRGIPVTELLKEILSGPIPGNGKLIRAEDVPSKITFGKSNLGG